ncbi:MAG TPA: CPBP family glutamic-type intramembrane protease [Actinomycetes bacterium]|nr:CPBP family glutamic-type intramembrane protease [Actinomycetes bacterium]
MTATSPPPDTGQPAIRPQPSVPATTGGVGGAVLVVGTRIALWLGVQLGLAGLLLLAGQAATGGQALNEAAGWWMVYGALVDLGTLGVIGWLLRRDHRSYRGLLGPPTTAWQVALGAAGVLAASVPAVVFSGQLTSAIYGQDAIAPMFAVVDLPPWASVVSVLVVPLLAELAEPVAYLGVVLPRLEKRIGRSWLAALIVVALWAAEHALYPLLVSGGGLDLEFAAYRVVSVLPFLATWTAAYYALGRRLLPIMAARWVFNGGSALALALGLVA